MNNIIDAIENQIKSLQNWYEITKDRDFLDDITSLKVILEDYRESEKD